MKTSVVLFSGGLDSTTVLASSVKKGEKVFPLTLLYGQRHSVEAECAARTLKKYGCSDSAITHRLDLSFIEGCSLMDKDLEVPSSGTDSSGKIPSTYVPARNIIFLSVAASYAESIGADTIYIGVNEVDYSGYPDCRPEFIKAFNKMLYLGSKRAGEGNLKVKAPLAGKSKSDIIRMGMDLKVDYSMTHSCYNPDEKGLACGVCDSCRLRLKGFEKAGFRDPVKYR